MATITFVPIILFITANCTVLILWINYYFDQLLIIIKKSPVATTSSSHVFKIKKIVESTTPTTPSANETLNNEKLVNIIREVVKEEFADHEKKFSEILKSHLETTNQRLNEISGEVLELTKSLEFTQGEVKEEITCIKDDLNQVKTDLQE